MYNITCTMDFNKNNIIVQVHKYMEYINRY